MMWMILQAPKPDDWVIATGKTTTVREFIRLSFKFIGVELEFLNEGLNEIGIVSKINSNLKVKLKVGDEVVKVDPKYFRPSEVDTLVGDASKAKKELGWEAETSLVELIEDMMSSDLKLVERDLELKNLGFEPKNYFE